jgi:protein-disulfide isomerase
MKKLLAVFVFVAAGIGAWLIIGLLNNSYQPPDAAANHQQNTQATATNPNPNILVIGNPEAKVTMIEYADYKCPECAKFHQGAAQDIRKNYIDTGLVKIVFRPYPIFGEDAANLLAGSYCAQEQSKLLEYHDALFSYMWDNYYSTNNYNGGLTSVIMGETLNKLLAGISIDSTSFNTCVSSKKYLQAFNDDLLLSGPDEIQGTPSFIIDGQKVVGPQPYSVFSFLLDAQLKNAR